MSHYVDSLVSEGLITHKSWNTDTFITTIASGTQILVVGSETTQIYQGSVSGQVVKTPNCTTFAKTGQRYQLHNDSTQNILVQDSASATLFLLGPDQRAFLVCTDIGSAAGVWSWIITLKSVNSAEQFTTTYPGTGLSVNYNGGNAHFNGGIFVVAGGTIALTASTTNGWLYVDIDGVVKQGASLPVNTMPLYMFTTGVATVTTLIDERMDYEQNLVWGVLADIRPVEYNSTKNPGTLEKYARADHNHGANLPLYKAGVVAAVSFTGNPRTATVTFGTAFPSANYTVVVTGSDGRSWIVSSLAAGSFVINTQASQALTGPVYWEAKLIGESV